MAFGDEPRAPKKDANARAASTRARSTCLMRRRVGGLRLRLPGVEGDEGVEGFGEVILLASSDVDCVTDVREGEDPIGRAFALSIHGFSGGVSGTVYCFRAARDKSHFFGPHTPTSTRQAAKSRFPLLNLY